MTNNIALDDRFAGINDIARNVDYYIRLSAIDRTTISCMLFNAGYNSNYAKSINPSYPKRQQWDLCREKASNVIKYCKAVKGLLDYEGQCLYDTGDGWDSSYKYTITIDGTFIDNEHNRKIPCPYGALKCLVEAANLFDEAFHEVYKNHSKSTDIVKIHRLAMFTNGMEKVIQKASGRAKAAKVTALYREMIRHRNTVYAIKNSL